MYNRIWKEGLISRTWKSAIITPLLKEGKDQIFLLAKDQ